MRAVVRRRHRSFLGGSSVGCWLGVEFCGWRPLATRGSLLGQAPIAAVPSPVVAGLLRRVRACNDGADIAGRPFLVGGEALGNVLPKAAAELARFPDVFRVSEAAVELVTGANSAEARTAAVAEVLHQLRSSGRVPMLAGWRDEGFSVKAGPDSPVELVVERAAGPLFGIRSFGCYINGLVQVQSPEAQLRLWVARRAATKATYPGMLDNIVAGGLAHGERPKENVIKECEEEAGIPMELAARAQPVGLISYSAMDETGWGLRRDIVFCYDLHLPPDFVPKAQDGEVEAFELWDMQRVIQSVADDNQDWKPNICMVIADLLVRRGLVTPEDGGYADLVHALRCE